MRTLLFSELAPDIQTDFQQAEAQLVHAFPASHSVKLGAILHADGQTFLGANIRRRGFSSSTCAERFVLDAALHAGVKSLERLVVIFSNSKDPSPKVETCGPCGFCRQQYMEALDMLGQSDLVIYFADHTKTKAIEANLSELLPYAYRKAEGQNV